MQCVLLRVLPVFSVLFVLLVLVVLLIVVLVLVVPRRAVVGALVMPFGLARMLFFVDVAIHVMVMIAVISVRALMAIAHFTGIDPVVVRDMFPIVAFFTQPAYIVVGHF